MIVVQDCRQPVIVFIVAIVAIWVIVLLTPYSEGSYGYAASVASTSNCNDSDNGLNYYTYGYVTLLKGNNQQVVYKDACTSNTALKEYYCNRGKAIFVTYNCPYSCSNGACMEQPASYCGDNSCNTDETCSSCPADCGACPPVCGDGSCNGAETCSSCAQDCDSCPPVCGDNSCNGNETCSSCPGDCGACAPTPYCGDGSCNNAETCATCPHDCGSCPAGHTYYVSVGGNDSNDGLSVSTPFNTLNHSVSVLAAGDTLLIMPGIYNESLYANIPSGESWSHPVTLRAYNSTDKPVIKAPSGSYRVLFFEGEEYIIVDGLILDGSNVDYEVVKISWGHGLPCANHIRISNGEIKNALLGQGILTSYDCGYNEFINLSVHNNGDDGFKHGIYLPSKNNLIDGCHIYNNSGWGAHVYNGNYPNETADYNIVRNSIIHDNAQTNDGGGGGILLASGKGNIAYNNIVYRNTRAAQIYDSNDSEFYNNIIYDNNESYAIYVEDTANRAIVRNNIVYKNAINIIKDEGISSTISNNLLADPRFVNEAADDFHIRPISPAIDAGYAIAALTTDIEGAPRPQGMAYDIGSYEMERTDDVMSPSIGFQSPTDTDGSIVPRNWTYINVSASDDNLGSVFIDWNRSLVGWWRFNNEAGENSAFFKDWSTYANNGTCTQCPTYTASGQFGGAYDYDTTQYITIADSLNLRDMDQLTIIMWVKMNVSDVSTVLLYKQGIWGEYSIRTYSDMIPILWLRNVTYDSPAETKCAGALTIGVWHQVVGVYNGTHVIVYCDAVNGTPTQWAGGALSEEYTGPLYIGKDYDEYLGVNGSIDEVMIFKRALSPAEINAIYNAGLYRLERNFTNLENTTYMYTAYAQDLAGNINNTETRTIQLNPALTNMLISINTLNDTYTSDNAPMMIFYFSSSQETASCELYFNNTAYGKNLTTMNNTVTRIIPNASLADGYYSAYVNCTYDETSGKSGVVYITIDTTMPAISFVAPTDNDSTISRNWTYVNVSVADATPRSAFIDWNNSLVAWYRFNNESGENATFFRDWSTYGNNGTCPDAGCPAFTSAGRLGNAYDYNTTQYINISDSTSLRSMDQLTISMWVKQNRGDVSTALLYKQGVWGEYSIRTYSDMIPLLWLRNSTSGYPAETKCAAALTIGVWHQVVGVYNGTHVIVYCDAVNGTPTEWMAGALSEEYAGSLCIGKDYEEYSGVNGSIDEVMIFKRALSPSEINATYNAGLYRLERNFTGLSNGTYTYKAYVQDMVGYLNSTETRTIIVNT